MFIGGVTNKLIMITENLTIQPMMFVENSIIKKEYLAVFLFLILAILLTVVIITASYFLARQNPESEKLSAYECGFEPYEDARHSFDIRFCLIAILFIIFDTETAYVIPWSVSVSKGFIAACLFSILY